jgi:hypothetical protein
MKQSGRGWGQIFKDMKAQGLVQEKSLGQVVRSWHRAKNTSTTISSGHSSGYASTGPVISTASGRTYIEAPKGGELDGAEAPGDGAGASGGAQVGSAAASVSLGGSGNGAAHAASAAGPGHSPKN